MKSGNRIAGGSVLACVFASGLAVTGTAAAADGLSYSYLEGGYIHTELDDSNIDGDGLYFGGSADLGNSLFIHGSYASADLDAGIDVDQWNVGVGGYLPLSPRLDLVGTLAFVRAEVDVGPASDSENGYGLGVGLRALATDKLELEGGLNHVDLGDDGGDDTAISLGGRYFVTEALAVGTAFEFGDDVETWRLNLRYVF